MALPCTGYRLHAIRQTIGTALREAEGVENGASALGVTPGMTEIYGEHGKDACNAAALDAMQRRSTSIHDPVFQVTQASGGNLLLNADGGPGGVGAFLTPDVGPDAILSPDESLTTGFVIGLQKRVRFTFFVDLLGVPGP